MRPEDAELIAEIEAQDEAKSAQEMEVEKKELTTTEHEKTPQAQAPKVSAVIHVNEHNYLDAATLEGRYRLASAFYKGGMVPKSYKSPEQVFAALEFARELGLKPLSALRNIAMINGSPSVWGDLPLALVRQSGLLFSIHEFWFDKQYKQISFKNQNLNAAIFGAICITKRVNQEVGYETWFTMDDAKAANLLGKDSPWKTYTRRMLQMRARSQNLKDQFPEVLYQLPIAEYDFNTIPQMDSAKKIVTRRDGTQSQDALALLNERGE